MKSKQKIPTTRFSKTKTFSAYFIAGHYLMCSSFAYAGTGSLGSPLEANLDSKPTTITQTLKHPLNNPQEDPQDPSSYFSPFQNVANGALEWMRESALSGCDRFSKWVASYAEDLPPAYFAKSLLELDYANDVLFWHGHFHQELEEIKKSPYLGLQEQEKLKGLQEIVWNGLLSPYMYEKGLRKLRKKSLFSRVKNIRDAFQTELKENPEIVLQHLRNTLVSSLEMMQKGSKETDPILLADFKKQLTYYRTALNDFDYAETLAHTCLQMDKNKEKLALSTTQYKSFIDSLNNELRKINTQQYFQIHAERESIKKAASQNTKASLKPTKAEILVEEEDKTSSSYFSYPLSLIKSARSLVSEGVRFTLENPLQAVTMGVALQAAAVAAKSPFTSPQQSGNAKGPFYPGSDATNIEFLNHEVSAQNFINLASLNAAQGVIIEGASEGDLSGSSVSSVGDFNGDGVSDVIVGAPDASASYIIYGKKGGYLTPINLASLNATRGVVIEGATKVYKTGWSVSSAGDFNGDGLSDVIVGAFSTAYVIYGKKGGYLTPINLASLNATRGVIIRSSTAASYSLASSSAGDFNGDGLGDIIIGDFNSRSSAGTSYVIYGRQGGYPSPIDLAFLNATKGVIIKGGSAGDRSGSAVSSAGDFNGDGLNDVIIGAPGNGFSPGTSYVIYGRQGGYISPIDLFSLNATQGVIIKGGIGGLAGKFVSSAGDFNGDGLSDVIVGAPFSSPEFRLFAGTSYIIYGRQDGYPSPIDLAFLNATKGVIIKGGSAGDWSGDSVSSAGDFNGDGLSDVIIGAPHSRIEAGTSYVIYGRQGGYPFPIDLNALASQGVIIAGAIEKDTSGHSVSLAGDFNGDGLSDIIIGAPNAAPERQVAAGTSYVIYGERSSLNKATDKHVKK